MSFNPSSLLSHSVYHEHSVLITRYCSLKGIGNNFEKQISHTLERSCVNHFTDFSIKDDSEYQLTPLSAVCTGYSTFYMLSKNSKRQLVLFDKDKKDDNPSFLDIGDHQPVALFGGHIRLAAIDSEGEVILINHYQSIKTFKLHIATVSLPDGKKASSVACCDDSFFVLSSDGHVFITSQIKPMKDFKISAVEELANKEIVFLSGTYMHCLAVSKDGHVFARGLNGDGQLGLGKKIDSVSSFTEISSLKGYEIVAAYAGGGHSLFQTSEGKILACGSNTFGQLFTNISKDESVYLPTETTIKENVTFCIAGWCSSTVFVGNNPPPNTPNMQIQQYE